MNRILAIGLLALTLAGCASFNEKIAAISGFTVTQSQLDAAESTYDGTSLAALHRYAMLPRCAAGTKFTISAPCHDAALLKSWRAVDKTVATNFTNTQGMITSGNNTGAVAAWNLLKQALDTASSIAAQSGVTTLM